LSNTNPANKQKTPQLSKKIYKKKFKKNVQIIKRKYIMTNIDTQETDYSV